jgi:quercetin dioxygenase-like cupin family protein
MTAVLSLRDRPWTQGGHPLEWKQIDPAEPLVVRLRFEPGFADPDWCRSSHVLYVELGTLSVELETETIDIHAGGVLRLDAGTPHRARNLGATPVELFVVSRLTLDSPG